MGNTFRFLIESGHRGFDLEVKQADPALALALVVQEGVVELAPRAFS